MPGLVYVMLLAALPAVGNFLGGLLADWLNISTRTLSLALHLAAGVILAIVGVELMPEGIRSGAPWLVVLSFVLGGVFFVLIDAGVDLVQSRLRAAGISPKKEKRSSPWTIFISVAVDLLMDGIMIGTGATIRSGLGLLLALGQVTADIPEGFITAAGFKAEGMKPLTRRLLTLSFALPVFIGAIVGYEFMRGQPHSVRLMLLTFTAGVLTTLVVEEIVPEAHREEEARAAALFFVAGFGLFTLLSLYLQ